MAACQPEPPPPPVAESSAAEAVVGQPTLSPPGSPQPPTLGVRRSYQAVADGLYVAVGFALSDYEIQVVRGARERAGWRTAAAVAQAEGAVAAINAGFFDTDDRPMGLLVSSGRKIQALRRNSWPVFWTTQDRAHITARRDIPPDFAPRTALQSGPLLVEDGRIVVKASTAADSRAAVGIDKRGRVWFAATRSGAWTLRQWAAALAAAVSDNGLGLQSALNLDGGSSVQFYHRDHDAFVAGARVPVHMTAVPRPRGPKQSGLPVGTTVVD